MEKRAAAWIMHASSLALGALGSGHSSISEIRFVHAWVVGIAALVKLNLCMPG